MTGATTVLTEPSQLTAWCSGIRAQSASLLVDAALADSAVLHQVREAVTVSGCVTNVVPLSPSAGLNTLSLLSEQVTQTDTTVAVGGGSVLDQAKLAGALAADPSVAARLAARHRAGWISLPAPRDGAPLVAVPTTVGTGSERSAAACLATTGGKCLVEGEALRPQVALTTPVATATLPGQLLAEGVFEALQRTIGPYAGTHPTGSSSTGHADNEVAGAGADRRAEQLAVRLATLGHEVRRCRQAGQEVPEPVRRELADLSGRSHDPAVTGGWQPFAYKAWFLATEISYAAGARKVPALAAVLPAVWRRIDAGDVAFGDAGRLRRIWRRVAATDPTLPDEPAIGVAHLARQWGVDPRGAGLDRLCADPAEVARRTLRRWGAGLPMLAGVRAEPLRDLLGECVTPGPPVTTHGGHPADVLATSGSRCEVDIATSKS